MQGVPSTQSPPALQVCGVFELHCFELGMHAPAHSPFVHTFGHLAPLTHCPCVSQVCGVSFAPHCFELGVHTPVQALFSHT